nr:MAG TPA: hypothetical protein [Caudoviricetes sp.]
MKGETKWHERQRKHFLPQQRILRKSIQTT